MTKAKAGGGPSKGGYAGKKPFPVSKSPKKKAKAAKPSAAESVADIAIGMRFKAAGEDFWELIQENPGEIPKISLKPKAKKGGNTLLSRSFDAKTGNLFSRSSRAGKYRRYWNKMDETFSTSSMVDFMEGAINACEMEDIHGPTVELMSEVLEILSSLRIPTRFSGYSIQTKFKEGTKIEVMQHPTGDGGRGVFGRSEGDAASAHTLLDRERQEYVLETLEEALEEGVDAGEVVCRVGRACIEFTLREFTAPITSKDVRPFSRRMGQSFTGEDFAQLGARERLKQIYSELGGKIDDPVLGETEEGSLARPWRNEFEMTPLQKSGTKAKGLVKRSVSPRRSMSAAGKGTGIESKGAAAAMSSTMPPPGGAADVGAYGSPSTGLELTEMPK
ncbi:MAG: hypothetical protein ACMVO3_11560 [Thalassobaculum sp.]